MHHLGIGDEHRDKKVIMIVDHFKVSVIAKKIGEILSQHEINPSRNYWTNVLVDEATKRSRKAK